MLERELKAQLDAERDRSRALEVRLAEQEAQLQRKELLLREVNHRIKNSLQLVASLLNIHRRSTTNTSVRQQFDIAIGRVMAIGLVHERLYKTDRVETVEFGDYLRHLCHDLAGTVGEDEPTWTVEIEADELELPAETALPLALIASELVTNACKHAYPDGNGGRIQVELRLLCEGTIRLAVADQGIGAPVDGPTHPGLGTRLVQTLTQQIRGQLETTRLDPGFRAAVIFPQKAVGS